MDETAWDFIYSFNGVKGYTAPVSFSESQLDEDWCMRCGFDWPNCTCSVVISESTFSEFMDEYGASEDDLYEGPRTLTERSCYDCTKQMTPRCERLLDFVHDVLQDYQDDIGKFSRINMCDQFEPENGG